MAHYAKVEEGLVTDVIVADADFVSTLDGVWVQTSYNTRCGEHPEGRPLRKNFAGIGSVYDEDLDAFYSQQPFQSWSLNVDTCVWEPPVARPDDGKRYFWDENTLSWVL